jgi:hypothetical protein
VISIALSRRTTIVVTSTPQLSTQCPVIGEH